MPKINFVPSNPGTATVPKFRSVVNSDGSIVLIPDGVRYLHDEIQSYEEQCNVNNIMRRYADGDVTALGALQAPGQYVDIFDMPQTKQEALQAVMDAQRIFGDLPADVRQQFGDSWEAFYLAGPEAVYKAFGVAPSSDGVAVSGSESGSPVETKTAE